MSSDYLDYFKLKEDPFRLTPDIFYYYESPEHATALHSLEYCMREKEGFCLLTGEPGTGKTTLLRLLMEKWKAQAEIALIMTPRLSPDEFLQAVLEDFSISVSSSSKNEMVKAFRDFLLSHAGSGRCVAIIVDEAQELPDTTLEELRLLSNLETDKEKLLQIILIGQPELRHKLMSDPLRQLNQRITVRVELKPLTEAETSDYLNTRLIKGGNSSLLFDEKAKQMIYNLSGGIPRTINLLASRSLMAASLDTSKVVFVNHVRTGAADVMETTPALKGVAVYRRPLLIAAGIALAVIIMLLSFRSMTSRTNPAGGAASDAARSSQRTTAPAAEGEAFVAAVRSQAEQGDPLKGAVGAFNAVARVWGVGPVLRLDGNSLSVPVALDRIAARRGLRISEFRGSVEELLKNGHPAILEIAPEGAKTSAYTALLQNVEGVLTISPPLAGHDRIPQGELKRIWTGRAIIPWKNHLKIPEMMARGSAQPEVIELQRLLNKLGVGVQESGELDEKTVEALKNFQQAQRLNPTGQVNDFTLMRIYAASPDFFHPTL